MTRHINCIYKSLCSGERVLHAEAGADAGHPPRVPGPRPGQAHPAPRPQRVRGLQVSSPGQHVSIVVVLFMNQL